MENKISKCCGVIVRTTEQKESFCSNCNSEITKSKDYQKVKNYETEGRRLTGFTTSSNKSLSSSIIKVISFSVACGENPTTPKIYRVIL